MKKLSVIDTYTIPLVILSLVASVLRSVALITSFNYETMHFNHSALIVVSSVIVAVSMVAFLSYFIFGEKEKKLVTRTDDAAYYIPAGILSVALIFMGATNLSGATTYPEGVLTVLAFVSGILALISAVSFFLSIFIERRSDLVKAAFSLSIVCFLATYAMLLYFNKEVHPTNSPNRLIDQLAYLFSAVFFLYEARIPLGRIKWRGYIALGLCGTMLCAYSSIPALILYFANGYVISESLIESILTFTVMIFIGARIFNYKKLSPDSECDIVRGIEAMSIQRGEEIKAHRDPSHAQDNINNKEENEEVEDIENYSFDIPEVSEDSHVGEDDGE